MPGKSGFCFTCESARGEGRAVRSFMGVGALCPLLMLLLLEPISRRLCEAVSTVATAVAAAASAGLEELRDHHHERSGAVQLQWCRRSVMTGDATGQYRLTLHRRLVCAAAATTALRHMKLQQCIGGRRCSFFSSAQLGSVLCFLLSICYEEGTTPAAAGLQSVVFTWAIQQKPRRSAGC